MKKENIDISTMADHELEALKREDSQYLFEQTALFFKTDKPVTRSVVVAMILLNVTDFECLRLERLDLADLDLRGVNFCGSVIKNCDFSGADLSNASFEYTEIKDCDFIGALFVETFMYSATFKQCDFEGVNLLYARERADGFEDNNINVNVGFPQKAIAINVDNIIDADIASNAMLNLISYLIRQGFKNKSQLIRLCELFIKPKVNGVISEAAYLPLFETTYGYVTQQQTNQ
ncbi:MULTISPECIES: pentapeptide repeat-containing protein [unclassified Vibrio]|uniref:pentapeptide repeat-containing protein n=1 Tax=unclassified Vibrio TaxID=2614977 RepID=UPI0020A57890|nr:MULTISPECIES: pentapeptide repeat-containing protein [unclassified Vibrio]HCG6308061.1 pentapeptide repeat-containing protein [Vibrio parahaemolyticus]